jgi:hypothetical protein
MKIEKKEEKKPGKEEGAADDPPPLGPVIYSLLPRPWRVSFGEIESAKRNQGTGRGQTVLSWV